MPWSACWEIMIRRAEIPGFLESLATFLNRTCGWDLTPGPPRHHRRRPKRVFLPLQSARRPHAGRHHAAASCCPWCRNTSAMPTRASARTCSSPASRKSKSCRTTNSNTACISRPSKPPSRREHRRDLRFPPHQSHRQCPHQRRNRPPFRAGQSGRHPADHRQRLRPAPSRRGFSDDATPVFDDHIILTLSLSKLGLPGTRTGIVVARPEITDAIAAMTSVVGLANTNTGQQLVLPLVGFRRNSPFGPRSDPPLLPKPCPRSRPMDARSLWRDPGWSLHRCEGSFFRWLRLTDLPIPTRELYQRLKARQVLVVPGENFFFGLPHDWPHRTECLRLNCSGNPETVREALGIIADEVRNMRSHGTISAAPAV